MMHSKVCLYISSFLIFKHFFHLYSPVFIHVLPLLSLKSAPRKSEVKVVQSCLTLQPHGLYSIWNSPGQHTGVGSLSLLPGICSFTLS